MCQAKLEEAQDVRRTGRIKAIEAFEPHINAAPTWTSRDLRLCSANLDVEGSASMQRRHGRLGVINSSNVKIIEAIEPLHLCSTNKDLVELLKLLMLVNLIICRVDVEGEVDGSFICYSCQLFVERSCPWAWITNYSLLMVLSIERCQLSTNLLRQSQASGHQPLLHL
jgi:hypothetical protein